jgi:hypothetical protein
LPVPRTGMILASTKNRDDLCQYQEQGCFYPYQTGYNYPCSWYWLQLSLFLVLAWLFVICTKITEYFSKRCWCTEWSLSNIWYIIEIYRYFNNIPYISLFWTKMYCYLLFFVFFISFDL